jgi:hypothetical protein
MRPDNLPPFFNKTTRCGLQNGWVSMRFEPPLAENLREIMNVCSQLFVASESGRITLQSVSSAAQCGSERAKKMVSAPSRTCGMKLSIEGYGDGTVSLLT